MADWWQWSQKRENEALTFAVVGVGRFGTAVCRELISNGADVLAADYSEKAIDDLRQLEPSIEARVVDCTDEESMKESGILEMNTVVVGISEPIEASITTTLIAKDSEGSKVKRVIARATSDLHEKMLKRVGADKVVFPSRMQGERLGLELVRPNLIERLELDNQTGIDEITVPEEFIGRSLRDLNLRKNYLVNVLAAGPAEELTVNPPAKYILFFTNSFPITLLALTSSLVSFVNFALAPLLILDKILPFLGTLEIAPTIFPLIIKTLLSPLETPGKNF